MRPLGSYGGIGGSVASKGSSRLAFLTLPSSDRLSPKLISAAPAFEDVTIAHTMQSRKLFAIFIMLSLMWIGAEEYRSPTHCSIRYDRLPGNLKTLRRGDRHSNVGIVARCPQGYQNSSARLTSNSTGA